MEIKFSTNNAAFEGEGKWQEIARVIRDVADHVVGSNHTSGVIMDINGNKIGRWSL
jgi:hypothetical protein